MTYLKNNVNTYSAFLALPSCQDSIEQLEHGVNHPSPPSTDVKERSELHLYFLPLTKRVTFND
jgi:hypothetical protein